MEANAAVQGSDRGCGGGPARIDKPDRRQHVWGATCLDERLPEDHPARTIVAVVERFDLSALEAAIKARGSTPGRPAIDPRVLASLWLLAYTENVSSGRELDRLCGVHDAYRWVLGGLSANYHTLNDFRVAHRAALDGLLSQMLAVLAHAGVVKLARVSQDGTRVRAAAGTASFRRAATLHELLEQARARVKTLSEASDSEGAPARQRAAQRRAARERLARVEAAIGQLPALEEAQKASHRSKEEKTRSPRASTTDAQARKMKMANGGFNPAYNIQLAVDTVSRAIVGVEATNLGSDANQSEPMREQVERRTGVRPREWLVDGGYAQHKAVEAAAGAEVTLYAPVQEVHNRPEDPHAPGPGDSAAVAAWRARMAADEAKAIYKERGSTVETVNDDLKTHRGLGQLRVRGSDKVMCTVLWSVLAYNLLHFGAAILGAPA